MSAAEISVGELPQAERSMAATQGHWVLARLGKRVLRPGGLALTQAMIQQAETSGADVVELAPGLGRTASLIMDTQPRSYVGVDRDERAAKLVQGVVGHAGTVRVADAKHTDLPANSVDVVVGEAMLSMQTDSQKREIVREAARVLRPGGRYAIHELALQPDNISENLKHEIRTDLARAIRVNARPLTVSEWSDILNEAGLQVEWARTAPMALLQMRRNIADEGFGRTLAIVARALRDPAARSRVLAMRQVFRRYRTQLRGVAIVARQRDAQRGLTSTHGEELPN